MTILSHTYLENLALCEHGGRAMLGPRVQKAGPAREGQGWHAVREGYAAHLLKYARESDVEVATEMAKRMLATLPAAEAADIERDLMRWVEAWEPGYFLGGTEHILEQRRWMTLDGREVPSEKVMSLSAPVYAYTADHVWRDEDGLLNVLDFKTGRIIEHTEAPASSRQLKRYAAAEALRIGYSGPVRVHLEHGRHVYREEATLDEDWRDVWRDLVAAPAAHWEARIASGDEAEYGVGSHCATCDVRGRCSTYAVYSGEADGLDDAGLLEARAVLGAKMKAVDDRIKQRLAESERMEGAGYIAELRKGEKLEFDAARLRPALLEVLTDEQADVAFTATKTSVEKALTKAKMKPAARKELLPILVERAGSATLTQSLSVRKVGKRGGEAGDEVDAGD